MRRLCLLILSLVMVLTTSCQRKKLTEVVEVPLPSKDDKMVIGNPEDVKADEGMFKMEALPYSYEALAPNIDALTTELHYSKHYLTYTNNLNKAVKEAALEDTPIVDLLKKLDMNNAELRNNAGGYYNHGLFWSIMKAKAPKQPKDTLALAINRDFGSFNAFKAQFQDAASKQFGSGWAWLVTDVNGKLQITSTANQDNPLMPNATIKGTPILCLDVWEHAYYLNYQYKRKKYIENFFNAIDWEKVNEKYEEAIAK